MIAISKQTARELLIAVSARNHALETAIDHNRRWLLTEQNANLREKYERWITEDTKVLSEIQAAQDELLKAMQGDGR